MRAREDNFQAARRAAPLRRFRGTRGPIAVRHERGADGDGDGASAACGLAVVERADLLEDPRAHVRRGGYARDLKDPAVKVEIHAAEAAIERGEAPVLRQLRPYRLAIGQEWFAKLRMDRESLEDSMARPRP